MITETQCAPHAQFVVSKLNVRKTGGMNVGELAASILATGRVLQNVIAFKQRKKGKATGRLEIVAGGRRWHAVDTLIKSKQLPADFALNYLEISEEEALHMSLTENAVREAMHPADEFEAMHALVVRGKTVEDVAAAFGVMPVVVKRRLRLAHIAPSLLQLYRNDEISLQQLEALALTDDHTKQEQVWQALPAYRCDASAIRAMLTQESVDIKEDAVALFVGVADYEKAGGVIVKDLFSQNETGYIQDVPLLEKLAMEKLEKVREPLLKEGAAWVDINPRASYSDIYAYGHARVIERQPTEAELLIHQQLQQAQDEFDIDQDNMQRVDDATEQEYERLDERAAELETGWDAYHAMLESVAPEQAKFTGALLTLDRTGNVVVHRHLIRPEDKKRLSQQPSGEAAQSHAGMAKSERAMHSEKLTRQLTAHRTLALQAELIAHPSIALITLAYRLVKQIFYAEGYSSSVIQIRCEEASLMHDAPDIEQSRAGKVIEAKRSQWRDVLPAESETLFNWMLEQQQETTLELIAFCTALTVNTVQATETTNFEFEQIGHAVDLTMSDWWTATRDSYFNSVSKQRIVEVVAEAVSPQEAVALAKMKKAQAADAAERAVQNAHWLPAIMKLKSAASVKPY